MAKLKKNTNLRMPRHITKKGPFFSNCPWVGTTAVYNQFFFCVLYLFRITFDDPPGLFHCFGGVR